MTPGRKAFFWVFLFCLGGGVLIGVIKLVAPEAASVKLNGEEVTGITALVTSSVLGGVLGGILGLIVGGITRLATRGMKKA